MVFLQMYNTVWQRVNCNVNVILFVNVKMINLEKILNREIASCPTPTPTRAFKKACPYTILPPSLLIF